MTNGPDTVWIETRATKLGFDLCGVVRAENFPELAKTEEWLTRGYAGEMKYLSDPRRKDVAAAMAGIRSVIVCGLNYNTRNPKSMEAKNKSHGDDPRGWISRYAWGDDYHVVVREKLDNLVNDLRGRFSEPFDARVYADTGPIQERVFAKYAGLGWIGKNTLLLNQKIGSWFFLGTILTTLDLAPTLHGAAPPPADLCGSCRRCIDACPTGAFVEPYVMDASRCISYLTIELRSSVPEELREPMGWHVFGCDICQDVCPWNRRAPITGRPEFEPRAWFSQPNSKKSESTGTEKGEVSFPFGTDYSAASADLEAENQSLLLPKLEWLAAMDEQQFRSLFRGSPVKRTKWRGIVRNACIALGNSAVQVGTPSHHRITALLERLTASADADIAESALWALSRIQ
jgi:epoxyqueuosine reductase